MTEVSSVVHLYPSLAVDADGAAAVVRSLIKEQLELPLEVYFGCKKIDSVDQLKQMRITWSDVLRSVYFWGKIGVKRRLGINEYHPPKVIHVHGLWEPKVLLFSFFAKNKEDVCVHSTHGMMSSFSFEYKKFKKTIFHFLFQSPIIKKYAIHIANSQYELNDVKLNFPSSLTGLVPNGVERPPKSFNLSPQRTKVLYFGRLHPKKNVHVLLAGFGLAQRSVPGLTLEIVGSGNPQYISELRALVLKNCIQNVTFKPAVDYEKRFEVFQNTIVTVLPSENENFGLVVAESLACGVPVIVSANMPWEDVVHRGCGWVVDITPENIAHTIVEVAHKSEDDLRTMGRAGAVWMKENYSWKLVNQRTIEIYNYVLSAT